MSFQFRFRAEENRIAVRLEMSPPLAVLTGGGNASDNGGGAMDGNTTTRVVFKSFHSLGCILNRQVHKKMNKFFRKSSGGIPNQSVHYSASTSVH
jgi:hypothetical protein